MAYEADRVVVELIAQTEGFDSKTRQSARGFTESMSQVTAAATKAEGASDRLASAHGRMKATSNNARIAQMELMHVVRSSADQFATGANATQIFAQHIAQVGQAAGFMGKGLGAVGAIMSSYWGIAIVAGISVLTTLISKHKEAGESTESLVEKLRKHAEHTQRSDEASRIWSHTLDGLIEHLNGITEALRKANDEGKSSAQIMLEDAKQTLANLKIKQIFAQTLVDITAARIEANRRGAAEAGPNTEEGLAYTALADAAQKRLDRIQKNLGRSIAAVNKAEKDLDDAASRFAVEQGKIDADPVESIRRQYEGADGLIERTRVRLVNEGKTFDVIRKQTKALEEQEAQLIKNAQAHDKGLGYSGRQVSFQEARTIAQGAGLQVNSAQRPSWIRDEVPGGGSSQERLFNAWVAAGRPRDNPAAPPGTSAHEGAKGRWALDIQLAPGVTAGKIKKLYADQGVTVDVFPERGHLHVSGSRTEAAAAEAAAERAAREAAANEQAFQNEKASAEAQVLEARKALGIAADEVAKLELQGVDLAHDHYADEVNYRLSIGKLHDDEAKALLKLNDERAGLLKEAIQRRENERKYREDAAQRKRDLETQTAGFDAEASIIESQEKLATTARERRDLEQRLLDLQYREEEIRDQAIIAEAERLRILKKGVMDEEQREADAAAARAQIDLASIPARHAADSAANARNNAGPLQDYLQSIPHTADQINEAFEAIAANGLQSFSSQLAQAAVNFQNLGDVGLAVLKSLAAQLIQMAVSKLFFNAFGGLFGGGGGGGDILSSGIYDGIPGIEGLRAKGGPVEAGKAYVVGEDGPELFTPSTSGAIIPNNQTVRPANDRAAVPMMRLGAGDGFRLEVSASEYFDVHVQRIAGPMVVEGSTRAAQGGSILARRDLFRSQMHRLE